jgi:hypothetical protein
MRQKDALLRVGDDDSGPEDIADDEDLECETVIMIAFRLVPDKFIYPRRAHLFKCTMETLPNSDKLYLSKKGSVLFRCFFKFYI